MRERPEATRRTLLALVLVPLVMSAALVATLIATWVSVRGVLVTLERGQGDAILDSLSRPPGDRLQEAFLRAVLAEQRPEGLRCIAVFTPGGVPRVVVGECLGRDASELMAALGASGADPVEIGGRIRMSRGHADPAAAPEAREPVLVEYEPVMRRELELGVVRTVGIGGAASLALVLVAFGLWRFSLRQQRMEVAMERDRHLASLGEMAAVLAHEIRNPLAAMKGHAQLLHERLEEMSPDRATADRVVREAVRLERLLSDLLAFVRSEKVERRDADPRAVLEAAVADAGPGRIEIEADGAPERWSLDPGLIQQVLANLLRNALQASSEGAPVTASTTAEADTLVFAIRDRGEGLPPEREERMFEPFFTTRVRGTGLGLAVARRIIELHRGALTAADHPDGGAVFRVEIPAE